MYGGGGGYVPGAVNANDAMSTVSSVTGTAALGAGGGGGNDGASTIASIPNNSPYGGDSYAARSARAYSAAAAGGGGGGPSRTTGMAYPTQQQQQQYPQQQAQVQQYQPQQQHYQQPPPQPQYQQPVQQYPPQAQYQQAQATSPYRQHVNPHAQAQAVAQQNQYGGVQHKQFYGARAQSGDQQSRLLAAATHRIKQESFHMQRIMDGTVITHTTPDGPAIESTLSDVLDRAVIMLTELSTSDLTPKNYYEMHMNALDTMTLLEDYLLSINVDSGGRVAVEDLYRVVQYCPKVLPRTYLQIAAGSALIRSGERAAKLPHTEPPPPNSNPSEGPPTPIQTTPSSSCAATSVLEELIDAVKGVQCPLRGLFLRHYLLQATRDKLPDVGSEYGTDTTAAYSFVLSNFEEMNKLWVRVAHAPAGGSSSTTISTTKAERKKREKERNELRLLVGTNLVRLSQLEGMTVDMYRDVILPRMTSQILTCKDTLAQAYLMDCIIQAFPDEFHVATLHQLLGVCPQLREKVNVRNILQSVMDRLATYDGGSKPTTDASGTTEADANTLMKETPKEPMFPFDAFQLFDECIRGIVGAVGLPPGGSVYSTPANNQKQPRHKPKEIVRLYSALLAFSVKCYPSNFSNVDKCLTACAEVLMVTSQNNTLQPPLQQQADMGEELEKLLMKPLDQFGLQVLDLGRYGDLIACLPADCLRRVATALLRVACGGSSDGSGSGDKTDGAAATAMITSNVSRLDKLLSIVSPLLRDAEDGPTPTTGTGNTTTHTTPNPTGELSAMEEERLILFSKLVRLLQPSNDNKQNEDVDATFRMYATCRKHFCHASGNRVRFTMLPLVYVTLPYVFKVHALEYVVAEKLPPPPSVEAPTVPSEGDKEEAPTVPSEGDKEEEKGKEENEGKDGEAGKGEDSLEKEGEKAKGGDADKPEGDESQEKSPETSADAESAPKENGQQESPKTTESPATKEEGTPSIPQEEPQQPQQAPLFGDLPEDDLPNEEEQEEEDLAVANENASAADGSKTQGPPKRTVTCKKVFLLLQKMVSSISPHLPELGFKLYLDIALTADTCATLAKKNGTSSTTTDAATTSKSTAAVLPSTNGGSSSIATTSASTGGYDLRAMAYEFMSQAFSLFEEEIGPDTKTQSRCIVQAVGALLRCQSFERMDYETLITKTTQYGAKVLKKPEQCKLVAMCSHLFFTPTPPSSGGDAEVFVYRNPQRVLECLQRSLKIADVCMNASAASASSTQQNNNLQLFIEVLEHYVYHFEKGNPAITDKYVSGLIALINEHIDSGRDYSASAVQAQSRYRQVLQYIGRKKGSDGKEMAERFASIVC